MKRHQNPSQTIFTPIYIYIGYRCVEKETNRGDGEGKKKKTQVCGQQYGYGVPFGVSFDSTSGY